MEGVKTRAAAAGFPLWVIRHGDDVIGCVGEAARVTLPMSSEGNEPLQLNSPEELEPYLEKSFASHTYKWCTRLRISVSAAMKRHAFLVTHPPSSTSISYFLPGAPTVPAEVNKVLSSLAQHPTLWQVADSLRGPTTLHMSFMSVPEAPDTPSTCLDGMLVTSAPTKAREFGFITTRVMLADSPQEVLTMLRTLLTELLMEGHETSIGTRVCWPPALRFPVNVHTDDDALRRAEHAALLLPYEPLIHPQDAVHAWSTWDDLLSHHTANCASSFRKGEVWERHLTANPHRDIPPSAAPSLPGAETLLTSGSYDFYHYRVDGFCDDGWGCAYRSLQTVLSWFQHAGFTRASMPTLRTIQEVLYRVDPGKEQKKNFVGSSEWIGSFEVMLVLQQYVPGLECTIRRMESGTDLDTDTSLQLLLLEHFRCPCAAPVMIGGSSYAHTIVGVHMNIHTMEAQYLIVDPHYSANPTNVKTAIKKGFVGWKEASKFFMASSWYNLCIPRAEWYDPR